MAHLNQQHELLASAYKRVDYFPQLLLRLAQAPVWDIFEILTKSLASYKVGEGIEQGQKFVGRLRHYLAQIQMSDENREQIKTWAFWTYEKERKLVDDTMNPEWKKQVTEADRATLERNLLFYKGTLRRIAAGNKASNTAGLYAATVETEVAHIEKHLAELNATVPQLDITTNAIEEPKSANAEASTLRPVAKARSREPRIAKLATGIRPEEIRALLKVAGVGAIYTKPGEWAAALRALFRAQILEGNAPEVNRWAIEQGYLKDSKRETIQKAWSGDWNEAVQYTNNDQKSVFRIATKLADNLLITNGLKKKDN
ncbi:hypothetical protein [Hymenobacter sp. B1770]|uniref:hypothetical protein n=1 Tax=Hymenobacter sp. B1770 TaxID=1718788 RepID=UPI003CE8286B